MRIDQGLSYNNRENPIGKCVVYIRDKKLKNKLLGYVDRALTGRSKILHTYIEDAPRRNYLPVLIQAVDFANKRNAQLVIPNIQHISRSLAGINALRELTEHKYIYTVNEYSGKPYCRKEYVETFVGVFERSQEYTSKQIKESINKKRKTNPNWTPGNNTNIDFARHQAELKRKEIADNFVLNIIREIRKFQGRVEKATLQEIADALMANGRLTARGKKNWTPTAVRNLLIRAEKLRR